MILLKLFGRYKTIEKVALRADSSKKAYETFTKAQKLNYIAKIGKREYRNNEKEIERLSQEIENLSKELDSGLLDINSASSDEAITIKNQLTQIKRLRNVFAKASVGMDAVNDNRLTIPLFFIFSNGYRNFDEFAVIFRKVSIKASSTERSGFRLIVVKFNLFLYVFRNRFYLFYLHNFISISLPKSSVR